MNGEMKGEMKWEMKRKNSRCFRLTVFGFGRPIGPTTRNTEKPKPKRVFVLVFGIPMGTALLQNVI
jgi:hypothetical protein